MKQTQTCNRVQQKQKLFLKIVIRVSNNKATLISQRGGALITNVGNENDKSYNNQ